MISPQPLVLYPILFPLGKRWSACLLTSLLVLSARPAPCIPVEQAVELKNDHQQASKQAVQRLAECASLERQFSQYDLYRSLSSSRTYGVDIRGRVWTLKRDPGKGCTLQTQHRLNRAEYEMDYLGKRIWSTFHYEDKQLCLYTREPEQKTIRRCYQPMGVISKLAPYFLN